MQRTTIVESDQTLIRGKNGLASIADHCLNDRVEFVFLGQPNLGVNKDVLRELNEASGDMYREAICNLMAMYLKNFDSNDFVNAYSNPISYVTDALVKKHPFSQVEAIAPKIEVSQNDDGSMGVEFSAKGFNLIDVTASKQTILTSPLKAIFKIKNIEGMSLVAVESSDRDLMNNFVMKSPSIIERANQLLDSIFTPAPAAAVEVAPAPAAAVEVAPAPAAAVEVATVPAAAVEVAPASAAAVEVVSAPPVTVDVDVAKTPVVAAEVITPGDVVDVTPVAAPAPTVTSEPTQQEILHNKLIALINQVELEHKQNFALTDSAKKKEKIKRHLDAIKAFNDEEAARVIKLAMAANVTDFNLADVKAMLLLHKFKYERSLEKDSSKERFASVDAFYEKGIKVLLSKKSVNEKKATLEDMAEKQFKNDHQVLRVLLDILCLIGVVLLGVGVAPGLSRVANHKPYFFSQNSERIKLKKEVVEEMATSTASPAA